MQRALGRLQASPDHEVLSVTNWLQPLARRNAAPAVRVRDETPVSVAWMTLPTLPFSIDPGVTEPERLPSSIYRLDGSVRIRQRQFRHAELNLFWNERAPRTGPTAPSQIGGFEMHRLHQSRPIQLGRLEYFDSPWLSVLILVEPWQEPGTATAGAN
jgi:hypothetical protein